MQYGKWEAEAQRPDKKEAGSKHENDGGAGRKVDGPSEIDAHEGAESANECGKRHHGPQARGEQAGGRGRRDEQCQDQNVADSAHGDDYGGGDREIQNDVEDRDGQAHGAGGLAVETRGGELWTDENDESDDDDVDCDGRNEVGARNARERAEEEARE